MTKKTIIVTGGSRGIGLSIVNSLLVDGYSVISIARNSSNKNSQKLKKRYSNKFHNYDCDISNYDDVKQVFKKINKKLKSIYGLINNAGINPSRNVLHKTSIQDWRDTINTNVNGTFYVTNECINNAIKNNKELVIINISSIAGLVSLKKRASYSASKGALISLTKSIATDYAKKNIRCHCICPAYISTELTKPYLQKLSIKEHNELLSLHKLGKLGQVEDISNVVSFLLNSKSKWMTGNIIPIDGGYVV